MKSLLLTINRITLRMILSPVFVPLFLLLAAGLRIWWICTNDVWPVSDFEWYYQCATNLAHGVGYRYNGEVSAFFPPGYPVFLSLIIRLFGTSLFAIKCFSVLLQVSAVYLVYLLGRRLTSSEVAGRLAMMLLVFYPNHIAYSSILASENLFIPLLLLGTELLLASEDRPWLLSLAGIIFGYAALTRPQVMLVPIIIFAVRNIAQRKQRPLQQWLLPIVAVHLLMAFVLSPWLWFTYKSFGHPVMTTSIGHNLWIANNANANGTYVDVAELEAQLTPGKNDYERDKEKAQIAKNYRLTHPYQGISLLPARLKYLYMIDYDGTEWNILGYANRLTTERHAWFIRYQEISQAYYLLLGLLFACALVIIPIRQFRQHHGPTLPVVGLCIVLYFTVVHLNILGMYRYHASMMPWVIISVGALLALAFPNKQANDLHAQK